MESVSGMHGRERIFCVRLCAERNADKQSVSAGYGWKKGKPPLLPGKSRECRGSLRQLKRN